MKGSHENRYISLEKKDMSEVLRPKSNLIPKADSFWTFHDKRREHGRLGRVETGSMARTPPIRTTVSTALHRRDACAPLQKSKIYRLSV